MDKINIDNLVVFANHGVYEEEAVLGQKFLVSAILETDMTRSGRTDSLENTINYGEVCKNITEFMIQNRFKLIEACALQLSEHLLLSYKELKQITIKISKPWAPVHLPIDTVSVEVTRGWHKAFIALGSNMGDKNAFLNEALKRLSLFKQIRVKNVSSFIETKPYGYTEQDSFLNAVCCIETTFSPEELLDICQHIEYECNRVRLIHWGPRTLDLDILFYDNSIISTERLNVPHPDMANRDFVLNPMAEIAPWFLHPITHKTMKQMWEELLLRLSED